MTPPTPTPNAVSYATVCWDCAKKRKIVRNYLNSVEGVLAGMGSPCDLCGKDNGGRVINRIYLPTP